MLEMNSGTSPESINFRMSKVLLGVLSRTNSDFTYVYESSHGFLKAEAFMKLVEAIDQRKQVLDRAKVDNAIGIAMFDSSESSGNVVTNLGRRPMLERDQLYAPVYAADITWFSALFNGTQYQDRSYKSMIHLMLIRTDLLLNVVTQISNLGTPNSLADDTPLYFDRMAVQRLLAAKNLGSVIHMTDRLMCEDDQAKTMHTLACKYRNDITYARMVNANRFADQLMVLQDEPNNSAYKVAMYDTLYVQTGLMVLLTDVKFTDGRALVLSDEIERRVENNTMALDEAPFMAKIYIRSVWAKNFKLAALTKKLYFMFS
jgi:hypothetical protein